MATFSTFYRYKALAFQNVVNLEADVIKIALINSGITPTAAASEPRWQSTGASPDFSAYEVVGSGYTPGGFDISGSISTIGGQIRFDGLTNPSWAQNAAGPTDIRYGIMYSETSANKICIGYINLGSTLSLRDGPITLVINTSGFFTVS